MNAAVGPFRTSPPTIGLTATTGARRRDSASRMPGTARIGAIEASGLDGPITIARASAIAASACSLGRACSAPRNSRPSTIPLARSRIMNSWNERQPAPLRTHVRTGSSLIGSTRARTPIASSRRASAAVGESPSARHPRALQAPGEVAVAEVEPHVAPERAQRVHDRERVLAQAPAALVDQIGQPERDEVRVGGDVRAVDLDVIAGVGDHRQALGVDHVGHAPRELGAAGAAGEDDDFGGHQSQGISGRPARRIPAWTL